MPELPRKKLGEAVKAPTLLGSYYSQDQMLCLPFSHISAVLLRNEGLRAVAGAEGRPELASVQDTRDLGCCHSVNSGGSPQRPRPRFSCHITAELGGSSVTPKATMCHESHLPRPQAQGHN